MRQFKEICFALQNWETSNFFKVKSLQSIVVNLWEITHAIIKDVVSISTFELQKLKKYT